jgi:hypothetical protein
MANMLNKIKFAKEATLEFKETIKWYELNAKGLGFAFVNEIDSTIERIKIKSKFISRSH